MRKHLMLFLFFSASVIASAQCGKLVINPVTGLLDCAGSSSGGGSLVIGTTTITGGVNGDLLSISGGKLADSGIQASIAGFLGLFTGTCSVSTLLSGAGTCVTVSSGWDQVTTGTNTSGGPFVTQVNALGVTTNNVWTLINNTAAAAAAQQISPASAFCGNGWKTTATAASQSICYRMYVLPVQGTTAPTGQFIIESSTNGGAYGNGIIITSVGSIALPGSLVATGAVSGTNVTGTGTVSSTAAGKLQAQARTSDPGCAATGDIGILWFDNTTTTTAAKKCMNVAGTLTWVAF